MKALIFEQPGDAHVLQYRDVPDPVPGPLDVVVEVVATTINHLDVVQRNGWYHMPGFTLPHISGMDIVGRVVELGEGVASVGLGDRVVVDPSLNGALEGSSLSCRGDLYGELGVLGATADGGYAQLCVAPATHVYPIPQQMSWHHAVAFPTAFMTAHHALFDVGRLQTGETVMIHAAGSGVSMAAIQWAKRAGAIVLATAGSEDKCERALGLGADYVCNNRTTDVAAWARECSQGVGMQMVFDHVGEALWEASLMALEPRGRLVNCGNTTGNAPAIPNLGYFFHMGLQVLGSDPYRYDEFRPAWDQYCDGDFTVVVDSVLPLAEGADAQEKLLSRDVFGKIVLDVS